MNLIIFIWISTVFVQEVVPGAITRHPRDFELDETEVRQLKDVGNARHVRDLGKPPHSSVQTEYEAKYQQKGHQGNESYSTVKGKQEIVHNNCSDNWNEFAEKCATLIKDLVASLANAISSNPGDTTNLQLQIKNSFRHFDSTNNCSCFRAANTTLSDLSLNLPSLFNKSTPSLTITTTNPNHPTEFLKSPHLLDEKKTSENEFLHDATTPMHIEPKSSFNQQNVKNNFDQIENPITGQHLENTQVKNYDSNNEHSQSGNLLPLPMPGESELLTSESGTIKGAAGTFQGPLEGSQISNQNLPVALPVNPTNNIEVKTENLGLLPAGVPPMDKNLGTDNMGESGLNVPQPVIPVLIPKEIESTGSVVENFGTTATPVLITNDSSNLNVKGIDANSNFNGNTYVNNNQAPKLPLNSESAHSHSEPNPVGTSLQQNEEIIATQPKIKQVPVIKLPPLKHPSEFIPPISLSKQQSIQSSELPSPSLVSESPLKDSFPEVQQPGVQSHPLTENNEMNSFTSKYHPEQNFVTDCPQENTINNKIDPSFERFPEENLSYKAPSVDQSSPSTVTDCPPEQSNVKIDDSEQGQNAENQHSNAFVHSNSPNFSSKLNLNFPKTGVNDDGVQDTLPSNNMQQSFVGDSKNAQPATVPGSIPENNLGNVLPINPSTLPQGNAVDDIKQMNQPMVPSQRNEIQNNLPIPRNEPNEYRNGQLQTLEGYLPLPANTELPPIQSADPVNLSPTTASPFSIETVTLSPLTDLSTEQMTTSAESGENKPTGISQTIPQSAKPLGIIGTQSDNHPEGLTTSLNVPPVKPVINTSPFQENYGADNFPNNEKNSAILAPNNIPPQIPPVNLPPNTVSTNDVPPSENHFAGLSNEEVKSVEPPKPNTSEMPLITVPQIQPVASLPIAPGNQLPGSSNAAFNNQVPNQMATDTSSLGKSSSGELLPHVKSDSTQISDFSSNPPVTSLPTIPFLSKPPLTEPSSVGNNLHNTLPENNLPVSPSIGLSNTQPTNTVVQQPNLGTPTSQVKTPLPNPMIDANVKPPADSMNIGNQGVSVPAQSQDTMQPFPNQTPFMSPTVAPLPNSLLQNSNNYNTNEQLNSIPPNVGASTTNQPVANQLPTNLTEIQKQQQPTPHAPVKTIESDSSLPDSWPEDQDELGVSSYQKATTFQTTSVEPTPAQSSVLLPPSHHSSTSSYPKSVFLPVNQGASEQSTTESSISKNHHNHHHNKLHDDEEDEDEYDDCCSCESCSDDESSNFSPRQFRTSACKDLEEAKRELKAIFDKIKKKLKCGRKAPKTISTSAAPFSTV